MAPPEIVPVPRDRTSWGWPIQREHKPVDRYAICDVDAISRREFARMCSKLKGDGNISRATRHKLEGPELVNFLWRRGFLVELARSFPSELERIGVTRWPPLARRAEEELPKVVREMRRRGATLRTIWNATDIHPQQIIDWTRERTTKRQMKLSNEAITNIEQRRAAGETIRGIAKALGISASCVCKYGERPGPRGKPGRCVDMAMVAEVQRRRAAGETLKVIAAALDISIGMAWRYSKRSCDAA